MLERNLVLPHTLAELADARGSEAAMVDVEGGTCTFADLHETNLRWAAAYRALGLEPGQTVVTMVPNSFEAYYAWLGAAWLNAIEVPANFMYRGSMLQYLLNNAGAEYLVIALRFLDRLEPVAGDVPKLRTVVVPDADGDLPDLPFRIVTGAEFLDGVKPADDLPGPEYYDTTAMIYTSGTTGPSKGVLVPWASLFEFVRIIPEGFLNPGVAHYTTYPAFHVSGKAMLYLTARFAAKLIIRESFSLTEFWNDIRVHGCETAGLVGPMGSLLMLNPPRPDDADTPLQRIFMGPLIPEVEEFKRRFGVQVGTGYGMTEVGVPLAHPGFDLPNGRSCGRQRTGPPGYQVRVVDEHDEDVGPNKVGELIVRADEPWVLNAGYFGMPERTAEAWRNGWFHTGDGFMYDDDGNFYFVDRMKDALRRRGENISSFEVEAGVSQHPAVQECAVVAVPSELGEDEVKVCVVVRPDEKLTPEELIEFLIPRMPRFMIPRYVEFIDELPKTEATFRTQKVKLREDPLNERTWDREAAGVSLPRD
jgi:carnitine-CoA ligase